MLRKLDLQRGLFSDDYQSLEIDGQPVLYVIKENTTAITRGVAVLIADSGISIVGQQGFIDLADELNKIGWVTILLPAPETGFTPSVEENTVEAEDETSAAQAEQNTSVETPITNPVDLSVELAISKSAVTGIDVQAFLTHEQQLVALLQAVNEKSQEYPGFVLVISKGTSAAWLSKIYAEKSIDPPDAFVAISPFWPDRKLNRLIPAWMATTPMPVLDLYSEADNGWALNTVAQREIAAIKSLKLQYRQRELLGMNIYQQHNAYTGKEIYGWISHMGW